jgi:ribonuclease E
MANKMLIDATHPEETRVVVVRGNRVEEFDFESASRRQLRGNIYLAKVTRVEPSLQAAFVEYGGNRHGFLAFSEIHPDYYQIPVADRQALIDEEERAHRAAEDEADRRAGGGRSHHGRGRSADSRRGGRRSSAPVSPEHSAEPHNEADQNETDQHEADQHEAHQHNRPFEPTDTSTAGVSAEGASESAALDTSDNMQAVPPAADEPTPPPAAEHHTPHAEEPAHAVSADESAHTHEHGDAHSLETAHDASVTLAPDSDAALSQPTENAERSGGAIEEVDSEEEEEFVESVGGADDHDEAQERVFRGRRQYKIQEVIKRRQVMLVQVVKEERGTKGAALTTYLSLAGRYSVLMPNTARGGGISRKITSAEDRKRLKEIATDLEVPEGMGVILRTAGANRTKAEVKRDFEYLLRLWETVRDLTLKSTAPKLVYEEGSLIKRAIRDLYSKDIDEVLVAGDDGHREAKDFMRMLMPSHAKNVKSFKDTQPLFTRAGIESQLDAMFSPIVQLRSGGYIVINQTEALVAIDVNSGRATREHHIEDTALKTNSEAAEEISRQLRLRDLAGLIVIDFIDMDEKRNNRSVERKLKECLKHDRARIQVGRISHFGLLEMSRQRIRSSVLESSTEKCDHCGGTGHVRSVSSVTLQLLRSLEEALLKGATHNMIARTRSDIALYVLNHKRAHLRDLEARFQITIVVSADAAINGQQPFVIERGEQIHSIEAARAIAAQSDKATPQVEEDETDADDLEEMSSHEAEAESEAESESETEARSSSERGDESERGESEDGAPRRRRRRRRGRRDESEESESGTPARATPVEASSDEESGEQDGANGATEHADGETPGANSAEDAERRRRRRGRRGGRRNRRDRDDEKRENGASAPAVEGWQDWAAEGPQADAVPPPAPQFTGATDVAPASAAHPANEAIAESAPPFRPQETAATVATPEPDLRPHAEEAPKRRSTVRESVQLFASDAPAASAASASPVPIAEAPSAPEPTAAPLQAETEAEAGRPRRTGWWAKRMFGKD